MTAHQTTLFTEHEIRALVSCPLVERGFLRMEGERRGARYSAGPALGRETE